MSLDRKYITHLHDSAEALENGQRARKESPSAEELRFNLNSKPAPYGNQRLATAASRNRRRLNEQSKPHPCPAPFVGNWGPDGQPTRTLFNPENLSNATPTSQGIQLTLASSLAGQISGRAILPIPDAAFVHQTSDQRGIAMPRDTPWPELLLQPGSRPISQEQLAAEVKSIYAGLTMVESKCIHVDKAEARAIRDSVPGEGKISHEHWQALIALHRTLLHEHHDFFLATQHPSGSPALRRLASKYSMPARVWKHGIHSFLELLRYRLPDSLEFMVSFIYTAYQMMSLLYETVPAFENTWIECLGDLGRYRMAIEEEDVRDRENWANVAHFWYTKAVNRSPEVGRLYHHLAILARANALQQLSLYSCSLTAVQIFNGARDSILTLFNPLLGRSERSSEPIPEMETFFIKAYALLFNKEQPEVFVQYCEEFYQEFQRLLKETDPKWREKVAFMAIAHISSLFDFGTNSPLRRVFDLGSHNLEQASRTSTQSSASDAQHQTETPEEDANMEDLVSLDDMDSQSRATFEMALAFTSNTATLVLNRKGDENVLPFVHILLAFVVSLANWRSLDPRIENSYVAGAILKAIPLKELCDYLNTLTRSDKSVPRYEKEEFIRPEKGDSLPLPEDHLIRGQVWSQDYFPLDWWKDNGADEEEKNIERASTMRVREERVKWLACRLSSEKMNIGLHYSPATRLWSWRSPDEKTPLMLTC